MVPSDKSWEELLQICPKWCICFVDVVDHSQGLSILWNPQDASLRPYSSNVGIIQEGYLRGLECPIILVNFYGPYKDRDIFWSHIRPSALLQEHSLILAGDLNFMTFSSDF